MTVAEAVDAAAERLGRAGIDTPRVDAEWLAGHVLGLSRTALRADGRRDVTAVEAANIRRLVERRRRREPLAYVLGEWGFRRLTLEIDARVLVPRPETEVLVERCLALLHDLPTPRVLDVGVGSGAIAIAIADEHRAARVTAVDSSPGAVELAHANAVRAGVDDRVDVSVRDIVRGLSPDTYDLVVANPPYIPEEELEGLEPEVRDWEPREALVDRGQTPRIAAAAREALRPGGWLVLETHSGAAARVRDELRSLGYVDAAVSRDLGGHDRIVEATWPGRSTKQ